METLQAVADRGYYKGEDIAACEAAGIEAFVPKPLGRGAAATAGHFPKEVFLYNLTTDTYACPVGRTLSARYHDAKRAQPVDIYCNREACRRCELRSRCTSNTYRRITRWVGEAVLDRMAVRLAARPDLLRVRRETVEHPFGSIKQWMNQGAFLMRGLRNVGGEFSLTALAYNLARAINLVGVRRLVGAL